MKNHPSIKWIIGAVGLLLAAGLILTVVFLIPSSKPVQGTDSKTSVVSKRPDPGSSETESDITDDAEDVGFDDGDDWDDWDDDFYDDFDDDDFYDDYWDDDNNEYDDTDIPDVEDDNEYDDSIDQLDTTNLKLSMDFESYSGIIGQNIPGWTRDGGSDPITLKADNSRSYSGNISGLIEYNNNIAGWCASSYRFPAIEDWEEQKCFSFWLRGDGSEHIMNFGIRAGGVVCTVAENYIVKGSTWKQYIFPLDELTNMEISDLSRVTSIYVTFGGGRGSLWIDDICVLDHIPEEIKPLNEGFEEYGSNVNAELSGWTAAENGGSAIIRLDADNSKFGDYSGRVEYNSQADGYSTLLYTFTAKQNWSEQGCISVWLRGDGSPQLFTLGFFAGGNYYSGPTVQVNHNGWKQYVFSMTDFGCSLSALKNVTAYSVTLSGGGMMWMDDIKVWDMEYIPSTNTVIEDYEGVRTGSAVGLSFERDSVNKHSGSYSGKFTNDAEYNWASRTLNLAQPKTICRGEYISVWVRAQKETWIYVLLNAASGGNVMTSAEADKLIKIPNTGGEWTRLIIPYEKFNTAEGIEFYTFISMHVAIYQNEGATAWFDDWMIEETLGLGGFEDYESGKAGVGNLTFVRDDMNKHSGAYSGKFTNNSVNWADTQIDLNGPRIFNRGEYMSVWVRAQSETWIYIYLQGISGGTVITPVDVGNLIRIPNTNGEWTELSIPYEKFNIPPGVDSYTFFAMGISIYQTGGATAWFDDWEIKKIPGAGVFEDYEGSKTGSGTVTFTQDSVNKYSGEYSGKFTNNSGNWADTQINISGPRTLNRGEYLSVWARADAETWIYIYLQSTSGGTVMTPADAGNLIRIPNTNGEWMRLSIPYEKFNIASDVDSYTFFAMGIAIYQTSGATVWFDDWEVKEISDPGLIEDYESFKSGSGTLTFTRDNVNPNSGNFSGKFTNNAGNWDGYEINLNEPQIIRRGETLKVQVRAQAETWIYIYLQGSSGGTVMTPANIEDLIRVPNTNGEWIELSVPYEKFNIASDVDSYTFFAMGIAIYQTSGATVWFDDFEINKSAGSILDDFEAYANGAALSGAYACDFGTALISPETGIVNSGTQSGKITTSEAGWNSLRYNLKAQQKLNAGQRISLWVNGEASVWSMIYLYNGDNYVGHVLFESSGSGVWEEIVILHEELGLSGQVSFDNIRIALWDAQELYIDDLTLFS